MALGPELCGDISAKGAVCVLRCDHLCQCSGPGGRERWWRHVPRASCWPAYIGQQVDAWFNERGLVPCIIKDARRLSVTDVRIHGSPPGRRELSSLCRGSDRGMRLRRATLADMCSWLPCRSCTAVLADKIAAGRWPEGRRL
jgi:hypothetical protein